MRKSSSIVTDDRRPWKEREAQQFDHEVYFDSRFVSDVPEMHWEWCNIVRRHCWDTSIPPGFDLYVLPSRDRPESGPPADISKYEPELA